MIPTNINTKEIGTTEYHDINENCYPVKHSVIFTEAEKRELEDKIAEDLYQIFTKGVGCSN